MADRGSRIGSLKVCKQLSGCLCFVEKMRQGWMPCGVQGLAVAWFSCLSFATLLRYAGCLIRKGMGSLK